MKRLVVACLLAALVLVTSVPVSASQGTVHIVQPGETLMGIARRYGVDMWSIARANGLANPNTIYVGQRLTIPIGGTVVPTGTYIVQPGDTLYSIARRFGVTVWAIAQANGIYDLSRIYVGQTLVIPGYQPVPPAPTPAPAPAPVVSAWRGEYFASSTPSGGPVFVRSDAAINFRWGTGAPDRRLPADAFSVHWTRSIVFKGGLYRFTVTTDDGARLWIDGKLVLDAWKVQPETTYTADVILDPGSRLVALDYYDDTGVAVIKFSFVRLGSAPPVVLTPVPPTTPGTTPSLPTAAWLGDYFANPDVSGTPAVTRLDGAIGFNWGLDAPVDELPEDYFSVRWRRSLSFEAGTYAFCATSDDGVRIYVDGNLVVNEWHGSNAVTYCKEATLPAGIHVVTVEYYDAGADALIYVWWDRL